MVHAFGFQSLLRSLPVFGTLDQVVPLEEHTARGKLSDYKKQFGDNGATEFLEVLIRALPPGGRRNLALVVNYGSVEALLETAEHLYLNVLAPSEPRSTYAYRRAPRH
jgi:hypothetical protein